MSGQLINFKSIGFRIIAGFAVVIAIGTISSLYGLSAINAVGGELKNIAEEDVPMTIMLTEITTKQLEQAILFERALRLGQVSTTDTSDLNNLKITEEKFIELGHEVKEELKKFELKLTETLQHSNDSSATQKFREIEAATKIIEKEHESYEQHAEQIFLSINKGNDEVDLSAVAKTLEEEEKLDKEIEGLLHDLEKFTEKAALTAQQHEEKAIVTMSALMLIGVVVGLFLGVFISRKVTSPVKLAADGMKYIAQGDLTRTFSADGNDEMAEMITDMNVMNNSLVQIVSEVRVTADSIASGSNQIAAGNTNLSQRTEEQASSLEETASSMEEMTSTVKQNSDSAQEANRLAATAQQQAAKGGEVVYKTIAAMEEINTSSAKIADIISTIDGIAFQTNLLALNAAVEAARAGEQGRGFAVVASEVRTLAQRSADAAKEIKLLIEDSVNKVKAGSELVDESGKTLTDINEDINKVATIVAEIASASREQTAGIEQVNTAITQMDDMTQQNAALVEEAAAASRSMEQQAGNLADLMSFFRLSADSASSRKMPKQSAIEKAPEAIRVVTNPVSKKRTGTDDQNWENF